MPLAPSIDTNIFERNSRSTPLHVETQSDSIIHNPAVPFRGTKRVGHILRRSHNVVDKADLTQIKATLADLETFTEAHAVPADYVDLGDAGDFNPEVLDGECSA